MEEKTISEKAREIRNEYYRKWRRENKEKVSAANRRYRESHKAEIAKTHNNFWEKKAVEAVQASGKERE